MGVTSIEVENPPDTVKYTRVVFLCPFYVK